MAAPHLVSNGGAQRRPQLPAFCRTRRPITVAVSVSSLTALRLLVLVGLLFQLSTLLLVIAGPVPPRLQAVSTNNPFPPAAGVAASGAQSISPSSDR
ncbi:hypothetical protein KBZ14_06310 [Synechococcus sp. HJ21-Hayes]|uniref:hypothetical protein n=1 Tax=unclassified Synechococcus TaxID=2626047 RepID=UPI0020CCA3FB|nr:MULTISPECIES: hypothetical protein [unclassified Synechococcus]MCP9831006.1 hypothetical protein [Synechococcus sp. JJ3a-Johnson]MCP9852484.1 hypothetical protein [Synechococcus sp. HJ21-Hayes]